LLKHADAALFQAKAQGRSSYQFWGAHRRTGPHRTKPGKPVKVE
jgi:hypothetical protein